MQKQINEIFPESNVQMAALKIFANSCCLKIQHCNTFVQKKDDKWSKKTFERRFFVQAKKILSENLVKSSV